MNTWTQPKITLIPANAEIGSYQDDQEREERWSLEGADFGAPEVVPCDEVMTLLPGDVTTSPTVAGA